MIGETECGYSLQGKQNQITKKNFYHLDGTQLVLTLSDGEPIEIKLGRSVYGLNKHLTLKINRYEND